MVIEESRCVFNITHNHKKPIDLVQMAKSLISFDTIARDYIQKEYGVRDSKILLKNVKEGSDVYQIILDVGAALPAIIEPLKSINEVIDYIKSYLNIEKIPIEDIKNNPHYNTTNTQAIKNFISPIDETDASLAINVEGDNNTLFIISSKDVPKMQKNIELVKKIIGEDEQSIYQKVLIQMHKATNTDKIVKDSSYCDDIVPKKAIATIFENHDDKKEVLNDPFNNYFLVDIEVSCINGEIKLYKVLKLHNIIPKR